MADAKLSRYCISIVDLIYTNDAIVNVLDRSREPSHNPLDIVDKRTTLDMAAGSKSKTETSADKNAVGGTFLLGLSRPPRRSALPADLKIAIDVGKRWRSD